MTDKLTKIAESAGLHHDIFIDNPEVETFADLVIMECCSAMHNQKRLLTVPELLEYFRKDA